MESQQTSQSLLGRRNAAGLPAPGVLLCRLWQKQSRISQARSSSVRMGWFVRLCCEFCSREGWEQTCPAGGKGSGILSAKVPI